MGFPMSTGFYKLDMKKATLAVAFSFGFASTGWAGEKDIDANELLNLSLQQLSNIEVTSVSKRTEKANEAAAAIFVVTNDDIRRSGATSIPEVLRVVPGLSVAQAGSHSWAISSRGATGQFANKLLVLIDGRSVYTPLFSGVWWEVQDMPLQDIERIEVIRGPGATLWGANAVNGVINIITKSAKDTQGNLISQTAGNVEKSLTTLRSGMKVGDNAYARVYAKYDSRDEYRALNGSGAQDMWNKAQGGFRMDGTTDEHATFTLQGDAYRSGESYPMTRPTLTAPYSRTDLDREHASGGNFLTRVTQETSRDSNWSLQFYFDNVQRQNFVFDDSRNTLDIDFQNAFKQWERHDIVWGAGYRLVADHMVGTQLLNLMPSNRSDNLFSAFAQDEITLLPNTLKLTLGSKFEHNDYNGYQVQPSARLAYIIDEKQMLWTSASHAVRTPNRFSDNGTLALSTLSIGGGNYAFLETVGNKSLTAEKLNAYELGYRIQPLKTLSFDVSTFYNNYGKLLTNSVGTPILTSFQGGAPYFIIPVKPINANAAHSHGLELSSKWDVTSIWKLDATYSYLNFKRQRADQLGLTVANASPPQQASLRSTLLLPHNVELNNSLYYVDELKNQNIPDYLRFDTRIAWTPVPNLELSLVGQNLLDNAHPEFSSFIYQSRAQVPRSIYGNVTWKF